MITNIFYGPTEIIILPILYILFILLKITFMKLSNVENTFVKYFFAIFLLTFCVFLFSFLFFGMNLFGYYDHGICYENMTCGLIILPSFFVGVVSLYIFIKAVYAFKSLNVDFLLFLISSIFIILLSYFANFILHLGTFDKIMLLFF